MERIVTLVRPSLVRQGNLENNGYHDENWHAQTSDKVGSRVLLDAVISVDVGRPVVAPGGVSVAVVIVLEEKSGGNLSPV
jgi:hypothetical protein